MTGPQSKARTLDAAGRRYRYVVAAAPYIVPALLVALIVLLALAT